LKRKVKLLNSCNCNLCVYIRDNPNKLFEVEIHKNEVMVDVNGDPLFFDSIAIIIIKDNFQKYVERMKSV
jgi:hypothetical protein